MIEHCISALRKEAEERAYRYYLTDTLMAISESAAKFGGGPYIKQRYADIIAPKEEPVEEEDRSPEEIIANIRKAIRGQKGN